MFCEPVQRRETQFNFPAAMRPLTEEGAGLPVIPEAIQSAPDSGQLDGRVLTRLDSLSRNQSTLNRRKWGLL